MARTLCQAIIAADSHPLAGRRVVVAFEVEHTTSICFVILRMLDLAVGLEQVELFVFLVVLDSREADVREELKRPAFSRVTDLDVCYIAYSELMEPRCHRPEATLRAGSRPGSCV